MVLKWIKKVRLKNGEIELEREFIEWMNSLDKKEQNRNSNQNSRCEKWYTGRTYKKIKK